MMGFISPFLKKIFKKFLVLKVHWDDPEGWDGEGGGGGGGGFRMGNTCTPMVDSCQCNGKPIQYCKVVSLQLK